MDRKIALQLKEALELLRSGQSGSARKLLVEVLKQDADSDQAWFLLSFATDEEERKIYAIQQALRINPGNARAIERLAALQGVGDSGSDVSSAPPKPTPAPPPRPEEPVRAGTDLLSQRMSTLEEEQPVAGGEAGEAEKAAPEIEFAAEPAFVPGAEFDDVAFGDEEKPKRGRFARIIRIALFVLAILALVAAVVGFIFFRESIPFINSIGTEPQEQAAVVEEQPTPTEEDGPRSLPPTWTPTPLPTATETPVPTATFTSTPPPTPLPLAPEIQESVNTVQQQVSELRGMPILSAPSDNIVSQIRVEQVIRDEYINDLVISELEDQKRVLVALGLVDPAYDLVTYALNSSAENIGGFYLPERDEIYVIGLNFSGIEKWVYAHEFTHALQDQSFDLTSYGVYPNCVLGEESCKAFQALAEGDATLLAEQWLTRFATGEDLQAILAYTPPPSLIIEEFPPPYVSRDLSFPYLEGRTFVEALFDQGGWNRVTEAYENPPTTTEQILHPQKYLDGEGPISTSPIDLSGVLGNDWRLLRNDSLGEWMTFLLLGYGADVASQAQEDVARDAAAGWNGDRLAVYYNDDSNEVVLAVHWFWDTPEEGQEFAEHFENYLDRRYDGFDVDGFDDGLCWETETEVNCFVSDGDELLWLMAPDFELIGEMFAEINVGT